MEQFMLSNDWKGLLLIVGGFVLLLNTFDLLELWTDRMVMIVALGMMVYGFLIARGPSRLAAWSRQLFSK